VSSVTQQLGRVEERHSTLAAVHARLRGVETQRLNLVEEIVRTSLSVFEAINAAALAAQALPEAERDSAAAKVIVHYRRWYDSSQQDLQALLSLEAAGHPVPGAAELKHALAEARLFGYESDRLRESARRLNDGKGIPFEEAMSELRRRRNGGGPA
jgi:hypothetical protein